MSSHNERDAIIIGAGVIGCAIALELTRRGLSTLNVDPLPAAGYGSTSHSSAIIRPYYSHVTAAAVAHEARFRWLDWEGYLGHADERGLAAYTECGGLVLLREGEEDSHAGNLAVLDEVGVDYRLLDADGVAGLYPGICLDAFGPPKRRDDPGFGEPVPGRIGGGIYIPAAGYVSDPQLAAHNLMAAAAAAGAVFRFGDAVSAIHRNADAVAGVTLGDGERLEAPVVINAAGPHSAHINDLAGVSGQLRIRTRAQRHEVAYLKAPSGYRSGGNGFVVDLDAGVYQRADGADLLIGTADPDCDEPDIVDPDDFNTEFTEQWTTQVYRSAQRFPDLRIENTARGTVGLYDVSNDWIPVYDRTDLPGYYLAIGTSGNQFKNAPVVGEILAGIVLADRRGADHDANPVCLTLHNVGRTVDLSFYSRNREIQQTHSVLA
ncbi:MAG: FAD-dependent oxidoreductase [Pseudomonadales bacterium]|jgi:sarcosine oxidase subunit beta